MAKTIQILAELFIVIFCISCDSERVDTMRHEVTKYDKAVLTVTRGVYARSAKTIDIVDTDVIARLDDAFGSIKVGSKGSPRADWKPQGTLIFHRNAKEERKVILGISEWTEGGSSDLEYPLNEELQATLKKLASDETSDGSK